MTVRLHLTCRTVAPVCACCQGESLVAEYPAYPSSNCDAQYLGLGGFAFSQHRQQK